MTTETECVIDLPGPTVSPHGDVSGDASGSGGFYDELPEQRPGVARAGAIRATLALPRAPLGLVVFAHGSGRLSPRNHYVASILNGSGLATLLCDLLTAEEAHRGALTAIRPLDINHRFNIELLLQRLLAVTDWLRREPVLKTLPLGYFSAHTGAAAALSACVSRPSIVRAVVSRGGRPDLATNLRDVRTPTLFIVGSEDESVLSVNQKAAKTLRAPRKISVVSGASHLFEEPGTLEQVAVLAREWFVMHLARNHDEARPD